MLAKEESVSRSDLDGMLYVLKTLYPEFAEGFGVWQQFMDEQIDASEMNERLMQLALRARLEKESR